MQPNIGTIDRIIRAVAGIAMIASYLLGLMTGTVGIITLVIGIVLLVTAAIRWCPPYSLLGINTGANTE